MTIPVVSVSAPHQAPAAGASLNQWLEFIEKLHDKPIDMGLERMQTMIARMGIKFECPVVTVAGTNGKGSTCAVMERIWREAGFRTAMHTSPHLIRFNERALLNGQEVSDEALIAAFGEVESARGGMTLSYFEYTGLAVLKLFQNAHPDVVILEIGLGGRLDAMNAVDPDVSIVAAIGIDHTAFLGNTREAIALEKAHIYRLGRPAICSDPNPPSTLVGYAAEIGAKLLLINRDFSVTEHPDGSFQFRMGDLSWQLPRPALKGENQYRNAAAPLRRLFRSSIVFPLRKPPPLPASLRYASRRVLKRLRPSPARRSSMWGTTLRRRVSWQKTFMPPENQEKRPWPFSACSKIRIVLRWSD